MEVGGFRRHRLWGPHAFRHFEVRRQRWVYGVGSRAGASGSKASAVRFWDNLMQDKVLDGLRIYSPAAHVLLSSLHHADGVLESA